MNGKLIVSSSPHISSTTKTKDLMRDVIIALIPALIASIIFFGYRALIIEIVCVATCVISEYICRKVMKREQTIGDLSAVVTGLLLAFNLPSSVPIYVPIIGGVIAIVMAKQMFGGIGQMIQAEGDAHTLLHHDGCVEQQVVVADNIQLAGIIVRVHQESGGG